MNQIQKLAAATAFATLSLIGLSLPSEADTWSGPAAYYSSDISWDRIFWLQVGWGNAIPGAQPDPNGRWCVHPNFAIGERLTLSANGVTVTCTIGDSVQADHVAQWFATWAIEVDYWTFHELGLASNNVVTISTGVAPPPSPPSPTTEPTPEPTALFFPETGHYVDQGFRAFFEQHGGVRVFGYPVTDEFVAADSGLITQCFERLVLEFQPNDIDWAVRGRMVSVGCPVN